MFRSIIALTVVCIFILKEVTFLNIRQKHYNYYGLLLPNSDIILELIELSSNLSYMKIVTNF